METERARLMADRIVDHLYAEGFRDETGMLYVHTTETHDGKVLVTLYPHEYDCETCRTKGFVPKLVEAFKQRLSPTWCKDCMTLTEQRWARVTTLAPSLANSSADSRPMPLPAPVISATFPSSRPCTSDPLEVAAALPVGDGGLVRVENRIQRLVAVGKQVMTETRLNEGRLSVASIAVEHASQIFDHFNDKTVLCIGAGKMTQLVVRGFAAQARLLGIR